MTRDKYTVGYFDEPVNIDSYIEYNGEYLDASNVVDILNMYKEENEELYKENKRLREILEYSTIKCKHLVSYQEGDYCVKTNHWFFDFEGYEDYCPTCEYCERR